MGLGLMGSNGKLIGSPLSHWSLVNRGKIHGISHNCTIWYNVLPPNIHEDNQGAVALGKSSVSRQRCKQADE